MVDRMMDFVYPIGMFILSVTNFSVKTSGISFVAIFETNIRNEFKAKVIRIAARELNGAEIGKRKELRQMRASYIAHTMRQFENHALGISELVNLDNDVLEVHKQIVKRLNFEKLTTYIESMGDLLGDDEHYTNLIRNLGCKMFAK